MIFCRCTVFRLAKPAYFRYNVTVPEEGSFGQPKYSYPKAPFISRKVFPGDRVTLLPELRCASKLFLHCLTKLDEPLTWETKSWLGQKGDPPSWVTLFRYKHFESPSLGNLVKTRRSECARALLSLWSQLLTRAKGQLFSHINAR